jgi:serine/threonine-protein kinase
VLSEPPGASVYLDDELIGVTDPQSGRLVKHGLAPGRHRLRLSVPGHEDGREGFEAGPGASVSRSVRLQPTAKRREDLPLSVTVSVTLAVLIVLAVAVWGLRQPDRPLSLSTSGPTPARAQAPASSPPPEALPSRFGDYVLLERLGRGGMASVYKAERQGEQFALKLPLPSLAEEPQFLERFRREADIGRTLYHPHIVRIFEQGEVESTPYFTMELIDGETLEARLRRSGALEPRPAVQCILGVAEALDYAHHKGVIHRDLKPSNIMLPRTGGVKVMDYGIARAQRFEGLTVTGSFLGSPDYVAPEVVDGKPVDARSDLYSLGVVFFEVLAGRRPFVGTTPFSLLRKRLTDEAPSLTEVSPGLPGELADLVRQLLSIRAEDRPPSAEALLVALSAYLGERT